MMLFISIEGGNQNEKNMQPNLQVLHTAYKGQRDLHFICHLRIHLLVS